MSVRTQKTATKMGRPRSFDVNEALEAATRVFWKKGYEGTSVSDLTEAMGINRPSLYAAFGDKESLYRKVLDHYANGVGNVRVALQQPSARAMAEKLLHSAAEMLGANTEVRGCLAVKGTMACGDESARALAVKSRAQTSQAILRRLKRAQKEGDLPSDANPTQLALFLDTVLEGMSVQAAMGANARDLHSIAEMALRSWP